MKVTVKSVSNSECVLKIEPQYKEQLFGLVDKECEVEIAEIGQKWSLRALRYAWHLTGELAKALNLSNEEMHFNIIRDYSPRYLITLDIGEDITDYGIEYFEFLGYTGENAEYMAYKGFKELNSKQMARVIDGLEQDARALHIPTKSDEEIKHILEEWSYEEDINRQSKRIYGSKR